ncbi:MAG: zf-HC2 domain-containing protein [Desulfobacteraceae bacterium]|jgi:anti-sigma factor RsiW
MKKTCPHCDLLDPFMDGELPEDRIRFIEHHLSICQICTDELHSLQTLKGLLHELDDVPVSMDFDRNFWKKVDEYEGKRLPALFGGWFARRWRFGIAPLLATFILVIGVVTLVRNTQNIPVNDTLLVEQLDLYQDYDVVNNLDVLEQLAREGVAGDL